MKEKQTTQKPFLPRGRASEGFLPLARTAVRANARRLGNRGGTKFRGKPLGGATLTASTDFLLGGLVTARLQKSPPSLPQTSGEVATPRSKGRTAVLAALRMWWTVACFCIRVAEMWSHSSKDQEARKGILGERKSSKRGMGGRLWGRGGLEQIMACLCVKVTNPFLCTLAKN